MPPFPADGRRESVSGDGLHAPFMAEGSRETASGGLHEPYRLAKRGRECVNAARAAAHATLELHARSADVPLPRCPALVQHGLFKVRCLVPRTALGASGCMSYRASPFEPECHQVRRGSVPPMAVWIVRGDLSATFGPAGVARSDPLPPQYTPRSLDWDRGGPEPSITCTAANSAPVRPPGQNRKTLPTASGWIPCRSLWRRNVGEECRRQQ